MGRRDLVVLTLIVAAYLALCGRALTYDFVWDDVAEIARSPLFDEPLATTMRATQADRVDPVLTHQPGIHLAYDSYRPLLLATHWIEVQLWGKRPGPMHATNLVLGAIAILLAHALARRWLGDARIALVPTALFALHPLHVESVVYISGRGDVLAACFALASALLAVRASEAARPAGWGAGACAAFALSLFSKESCLALPFAVAALLGTTGGLRRRWWIPVALAATAAGCLAVRAALIATSSSPAIGKALANLPGIWAQYIAIAVRPFDSSTDRPFDPLYVPIGWTLVALCLAGIVWKRRALGWTWPPVISGIVWACVLLGPIAVVIVTTGIASDRYFYLPLLGFAVALADGGARLARRAPSVKRPLYAIAALWAGMLVVVTWRQVPVWSDELTLHTNAVAMAPDAPAPHYRLGLVYAQAELWPEATEQFAAAVERDPHDSHALDDLGVALLRTQRFAEAEDVLVRAAAASPAAYRPWFNLGVARIAQGKRAGCADVKHALAINPHYANALAELQRSCR